MLTFRDQAFLASVKRSGFVPPSIGDLVLWVRPESLSALANNDPVANWPDESGNGNDLSNGTAASQPTFKTAQLNGHAGVEFDGADDKLTAVLLTTNTDYTMFLVLKFNSAAGTEVPFRVGELGGYGLAKIAGNRTVLHRNVADLTDGAATTNAELWSVVRTSVGPLASFFVNTAGQAISNDASNVLAPDAITYMGQFNPGAGLYFAGQIYECMVYETNLSLTDRQTVEAYLMSKYAL